jgi:3-hydroxy-9,10-secoandrosta-1,3,5(10)-triene-9,17-dione monooxygenase
MSDLQEASNAELVGRARAMTPTLRERAGEVEKICRLPEETMAELRAADLFRVLQPKEFGGLERNFGTMVEVAFELGRGCASTAWVYQNLAMHQLLLGFFPRLAQEEFWGVGAERLISTAWASTHSSARPVEGGYLVSGHWHFASGVLNNEGIVVMAPVEGREIAPGIAERRFFLLDSARGDYEIQRVWDVIGLRGTGSEDVVCVEIFVPEHRSLATAKASAHGDEVVLQGEKVHSSTFYRIPLWSWFPMTIAPALIGAAQGGLETMIERLKGRTDLFGNRLCDREGIKRRLAEAAGKIDSARLLFRRDLSEMAELSDRWEVPTVERRAVWRRDAAYSAVLAYEAVGSLFYRGGAHGIDTADALARAYRDVGAGVTHVSCDFDVAGEIFGEAAQGLPVKNPNF